MSPTRTNCPEQISVKEALLNPSSMRLYTQEEAPAFCCVIFTQHKIARTLLQLPSSSYCLSEKRYVGNRFFSSVYRRQMFWQLSAPVRAKFKFELSAGTERLIRYRSKGWVVAAQFVPP
ncbi:hypothetical protein ECG_07478 [Echinococcus granulosus]|uniref:SH3 domain-containing protein n=1 Tax=Echinococcus granulosus TaxID=6210 RepID=A0A068X1C4_ECHGR|nr:hypothetical protein ECG_07478 [Echinococcus granulosus]CDS24582.1 hypothetical protein EgrG_000394600 [Echinococcus granulosus]